MGWGVTLKYASLITIQHTVLASISSDRATAAAICGRQSNLMLYRCMHHEWKEGMELQHAAGAAGRRERDARSERMVTKFIFTHAPIALYAM
uniref:Putative secreted protein n=1 Tax=Anopheles darlingi TaxID=43151 RepID=A0A2M4D4L5_ANODA